MKTIVKPTISPRALASLLPAPDPVAFAAVDARSIAYPLGSGQAEEIALRAGLRPMIRQLLADHDVDRARASFERLGFVTGGSPRVYGPTREGWIHTPDPSSLAPELRRAPFFIGRSRAAIEEAIAAETTISEENHRTLGRLLGYPRCCVDAFVSVPKPRRNDDVLRASVAATASRFAPRLNVLDLGVFHWISWIPCSFDCELSLRYANATAEIVARRHPAFADNIDAALAAHRLVFLDDVQLSVRGHFDGAAIRVENVWPTARDRHPSSPVSPDAREATARALAFLRGARVLMIDGATLIADDARLETAAPIIFAPFGRTNARAE